jgi:hypothetical protein
MYLRCVIRGLLVTNFNKLCWEGGGSKSDSIALHNSQSHYLPNSKKSLCKLGFWHFTECPCACLLISAPDPNHIPEIGRKPWTSYLVAYPCVIKHKRAINSEKRNWSNGNRLLRFLSILHEALHCGALISLIFHATVWQFWRLIKRIFLGRCSSFSPPSPSLCTTWPLQIAGICSTRKLHGWTDYGQKIRKKEKRLTI